LVVFQTWSMAGWVDASVLEIALLISAEEK
jgi:hypothetical protein